jgi:hypothetical protein
LAGCGSGRGPAPGGTLEEPSTRGWDNLVHIVEARAAIDHNGKIAAYEYHGWICAIAQSIDTSAIRPPGCRP